MILLARPAPHLPRTLQALQALGYGSKQIISFSLAEPLPLPVTLPPTTTALIFTSRFGIPPHAPFRHLPTYCVGGCTANAAKAAGFNVVYTGVNNGHTMAQAMLPTLATPQHFAHLHGDHAGMAWHSILTNAGHHITPLLAYRTNPIPTLPEPIRAALLIPRTSYLIPLFSAGSAQHLAKLLKQANIPPSGTALCLSPAVAQAAAPLWPCTQTAAHPNLEGLLALLPPAHQEG